MPALSVVVPTRNRPDRLARCLAALHVELRDGDELIVVDSASADATTAVVAADGGARVLREALPGASRARNRGWRAAAHDLVAFVDDDVTVAAGWRDAMVAALTAPDAPAFVAGRVTPPPEQADVGHPVAVVPAPTAAPIDRHTVGTLGASANLGVRRAVLDAVGGFDVALGPGAPIPAAEDLDLIDRMVEAGHVGRFAPAALAHHDQWRTRRERVALDWGYGVGQGVRLRRVRARDPERARRLTRHVVSSDLAAVRTALRVRYRMGFVCGLVRMGGMVVGAAVRSSSPATS